MLSLFAALAHSAPPITMAPLEVGAAPALPELLVYVPLPHRFPAPTAVPAGVDAARSRYLEAHARTAALWQARAAVRDAEADDADWHDVLAALPVPTAERAALSAHKDADVLRLALRSLSASAAVAESDALAALLAWTPDGSAADTAAEWAWYTFEQDSRAYFSDVSDWEATEGTDAAFPVFEPHRVAALLAHTRPDDPLAALLRLHLHRLGEVDADLADLALLMACDDAALAADARLQRAILHDKASEHAAALALYTTLQGAEVRYLEAEARRQLRDWDGAAAALITLLSAEGAQHFWAEASRDLARIALSAADARGDRLADVLVAAGAAEHRSVWEAAAEAALAEAPDQLPPLRDHIAARWPASAVLASASSWRAPAGAPAEIVRQQVGQLAACIERVPWQGAAPAERLDVSVRVRRGAVQAISIDGTADGDLSACLARRVSAWTFAERFELHFSLIVW